MTAVDTNILIRILTNDDADQARRATIFMRRQERIYLLKTVLLEFERVLRSSYGFAPGIILLGIRDLLRAPNLEVEDERTIVQALSYYEEGMDFADAMHLASVHGETEFATFDVALRQTAQRLGISRVLSI